MISCKRLVLIILAMLVTPQVFSQASDPLPGPLQSFEKLRMGWLAQQQARAGQAVNPFQTDGCSGGLSDAWQGLADVVPVFRVYLGEKPPWEHCCVEHDRAYWLGETKDGFELRLRADEILRQCVVETGQFEGESIAQKLAVSKVEVVEAISLIADTMFDAVRIGGGPCTGLPWRWGHGWPACLGTEPVTGQSNAI